MEKICFLFPGQGSQKKEMGVDLAQNFSECKKVFECASDIFSFDLLNFCKNASIEELKKTEYCQPLIVATNIAAFKTIEKIVKPDFLVGHSLGQYCSLYVSNILSLEDTFKILKIRIESIKKFFKEKSIMAAIIGVPPEKIEKEFEKVDGYVVCANYNSPLQTVISGEEKAVLKVTKNLENIAKRCIILNVPSAFHCNLMKDSAIYFEKHIENFVFNTPTIPVYSNVTASIIENKDEIKKLLIKHFTHPVLFTKILQNLEQKGALVFIELGEGTTLCSLVKKTLTNTTTLNIKDNNTFLKTTLLLRKKFDVTLN